MIQVINTVVNMITILTRFIFIKRYPKLSSVVSIWLKFDVWI